MSSRTGDTARFNRLRKAKIRQRAAMRLLRKQLTTKEPEKQQASQ